MSNPDTIRVVDGVAKVGDLVYVLNKGGATPALYELLEISKDEDSLKYGFFAFSSLPMSEKKLRKYAHLNERAAIITHKLTKNE